MTRPVSAAAFREALSRFASGVTIVAAHGPAGLVGFTATGFTSVSLHPPLILVCIGKEASAYAGFAAAEHFGVSILDERQAWIAAQFARKNVDRFDGIVLARHGSPRAPLVDGALAHMECRTYARHDAGDHTMIVGEVVETSVGSGKPLLHFDRTFGGFVASAA